MAQVKYIHQTIGTWDLWLERSKTHPLEVAIHLLFESREASMAVGLLLDRAMANFVRWHNVQLIFPGRVYLAFVPEFSPTLERLLLMGVDIIPASLVPAMILSSFQEKGRVIGGTTFVNERVDSQLLDLEDRVVTVQSLRCLDITRISRSDLESTLRRLILPSLSELRIALAKKNIPSARKTGLYSMLQRSNAQLKLLELCYVQIGHDELYDVLLASPLLETISMSGCAAGDLINILTIQSHACEEDILCLQLSKMTFDGRQFEGLGDAEKLVDMVESRWKFARSRNHPTVLSVELFGCPEGLKLSRSHSEALARCISEGLNYECI